MANIEECKFAGLDPKVVERLEHRITKLLKDMSKHQLTLFCGSANSIRFNNFRDGRPLVVGDFSGSNTEGGCGAIQEDEDGLRRGE